MVRVRAVCSLYKTLVQLKTLVQIGQMHKYCRANITSPGSH